ncbi:hypothetical protein F4083_09345, partial [Candidatus Poribacteria bacterium]|nr:hypothetical protein [Candidatus Poribacteria bacterium]
MLEHIKKTKKYQTLVDRIKNGEKLPYIRGLLNASIAYFLASLMEEFYDKSFLFVFPSRRESEQVLEEVRTFHNTQSEYRATQDISHRNFLLFPAWQNTLFEGATPSKNISVERMRCLHRLISKDCQTDDDNSLPSTSHCAVFTSIRSVLYKLAPREILTAACRTLRKGDEIEFHEFVSFLIRSGYRQVELVEVKGEFAHRGDIVDVFPLTSDSPVRFDFFDDEIDDIRLFDTTSQVSIERVSSMVITPVSEVCPADISIPHWKSETEKLMNQIGQSTETINHIKNITQKLEENLKRSQIESWDVMDDPPLDIDGIEAFLPMLYPKTDMLTDYLPNDTIVVSVEPRWQIREVDQMREQLQEITDTKLSEGKLIPPLDSILLEPDMLQSKFDDYANITISLASSAINRKDTAKDSIVAGTLRVPSLDIN